MLNDIFGFRNYPIMLGSMQNAPDNYLQYCAFEASQKLENSLLLYKLQNVRTYRKPPQGYKDWNDLMWNTPLGNP